MYPNKRLSLVPYIPLYYISYPLKIKESKFYFNKFGPSLNQQISGSANVNDARARHPGKQFFVNCLPTLETRDRP